MRISDWSSDVCSSDLAVGRAESGLAECRVGFRSDIAAGHEAVRPIVGVPDDIVAAAAIAGLAAAFLVKIIGSQNPGEGRSATYVREELDFLRKLFGTFAQVEAAEIIRREVSILPMHEPLRGLALT